MLKFLAENAIGILSFLLYSLCKEVEVYQPVEEMWADSSNTRAGVGAQKEAGKNWCGARRQLEVCQKQHPFIILGKQILGGIVSIAMIKKAEEKNKICRRKSQSQAVKGLIRRVKRQRLASYIWSGSLITLNRLKIHYKLWFFSPGHLLLTINAFFFPSKLDTMGTASVAPVISL